MKKTIKMNEQELHKLISESVKRVLNEYDDFNEIDRAWYNIDTPDELCDKIRMGTATEKEILNAVRNGCDADTLDTIYAYGSPELQKKVDMELDWFDYNNMFFGHKKGHISRHNRDNFGNTMHDYEPVCANNAHYYAVHNGACVGYGDQPSFMKHSNHINDINLNTYDSNLPYGMWAQSDDERLSEIGKAAAPTIRQSFENGQKLYKRKH